MIQNTVDKISVSCKTDRKSTRLNSSHVKISYAVFCLKEKTSELQSRENLVCSLLLEKKKTVNKGGMGANSVNTDDKIETIYANTTIYILDQTNMVDVR